MPSMSNTVGLQAKLASPNVSDSKQLFYSTSMLDNGSYRFKTKASGNTRVLLANNASVYNNTSIVQGNTGGQWNDQWLVEIANNKRVDMAVAYAQKSYFHRLATYPNFDYYLDSNKKIYESVNFASQCLTAGGYNYFRTGNDADWWYVNKKEHAPQSQFYNFEGLSDSWDIKNKWYKPSNLYTYLTNSNYCNRQHIMIEDASYFAMGGTYVPQFEGINCYKGDIILIRKKSDGSIVDVAISAHNASNTLFRDMLVYSHSPNPDYNNDCLNQVVMHATGYSCTECKVEIIHTFT